MSQHSPTDLTSTPRYASAWALLVYVLCVMTVAWPALTGGFLISPISDQYIGGFPVRDFAAQSLKSGLGMPLWNPYLMSGMPYIAAMGVGDVFYPTQLLRILLPVDIGMTLGFIIHVVLAGFFTFLFCRGAGLSFLASLIAGAGYMLSGPIGGLVSPGHDGKLFVATLTPLFLLLLIRGMRDGRHWVWGALAIVTGLALLTPHPQLLQYMLLLGGFFALYLAFGEWNGVVLARRVAVTRLGFALGAIGLGFLIGAIQYTSLIEYVPWSPRAGGKGYDHAVSYSMPIEEILNTWLPEFSGILGRYWGRNGLHFHSEYVGPALLMLATAAIGATGKAVAFTRRFKLFWLGALVVSLLWAFGGFTPFYQLIYAIVPGTKFFRAPSTIMFISMFATAVFAAIGIERLLTLGVSRRFIYIWGAVAAGITLLAVTGALTNVGVAIAGGANAMAASAERAMDNRGALTLGGLRALFFALITLGVFWGIAERKLVGQNAAIALLVVIVADLWSVERRYWQFSPRAAKVYGSDPAIDYLKRNSDSARVMPLMHHGLGGAYRDVMLNYDGLMVHRVRQVIGSHGNELGNFDRVGGVEDNWERMLASPHLWSLFNVRFLLTNISPDNGILQRAFAGSSLVAGPVRNAPGTMVYLYRLPGDNPPAWVATATLKAPDDAALATVQDPRFNATTQRRVALIDSASPTASTGNPNGLPAPSAITAQVRRPNHGRILVDLSAPAQDGNMLIVSENFYPGWKARIDGREARTERVDYTLIGVPLVSGATKIELEFTDDAYERGKLITLVAIAAALALWVVGFLAGRRATHAEAA
jgi:zinc transporter ZupT